VADTRNKQSNRCAIYQEGKTKEALKNTYKETSSNREIHTLPKNNKASNGLDSHYPGTPVGQICGKLLFPPFFLPSEKVK